MGETIFITEFTVAGAKIANMDIINTAESRDALTLLRVKYMYEVLNI